MPKRLSIKKIERSGTLTSGSPVVNILTTSMVVGDPIYGTGIPAGTRIKEIDVIGGTITLGNAALTADVNATESGSQLLSIMTDDIVVKKAEKLNKTVKINGVSFDGSEDVTITTQALTNQQVLDLVKEVDGTGSGLDADLLDGNDSTYFASKEYVDNVAQGLKAAPAAEIATLANLSANYYNGPANDGIGATLTATANGAFPTIDGFTLTSTTFGSNGILVKNQTNAAHNGRYNMTQQGTASLPWILTKCIVCDESDEIPGSYIFIKNGTTLKNTGWIANVANAATFTVGTDAVNYFQFSGAGTFTAGDGLELDGPEFSVDTDRVVTRDVNGNITATSGAFEFIDLDTTPGSITNVAGRIYYNADEDTVNIVHTSGETQQVGQEFYMPPTSNNSGVQINAGDFVMATGVAGNSDRMTIAKAATNGTVNPMFMIGVAAVNIPNGGEAGKVTTNGLVRNINTNAWPKGTVLYPNPATPGGLTSAVPTAPSIKTPIAFVIRQGTNNGIILVRMTTGSRLGETDSNVEFVSLADKQMIAYNGANSRWENTTNLGWDFANSRLGVGTMTPTEKLEVVGDIKATAGINAEVGRFDRIRLMSDGTEGVTISSPNDIRLWTYKGVSFSASMDTVPEGIAFKSDGTIMYLVGSGSDTIRRYDLSTGWDITTATFIGSSPNVGDATPSDIYLKEDGTKIYLTASTADTIREFDLTTPFDISTLTFVQAFSVVDRENNPTGLFFSDDGLNMYVVGTQFDTVLQYSLSTAWNISTASFTRQFSVGQYSSSPQSIDFDLDGTRMYIVGSTRDHIQRYDLSTGWDISTAVFFGETYVGHEELTPLGIWVENSLNKVFVVGSSTDRVYEYAITANGLVITSDTTYLKGSVEIDESLYVDKQIRARGAVNFDSTLSVGSTVTGGGFTSSGTISFSGASTTINSYASSANSTVNLGIGATPATYIKTINMGINGAAGSTTRLNIGPANSSAGLEYKIFGGPLQTEINAGRIYTNKKINGDGYLAPIIINGMNPYEEPDLTPVFYDSFTEASTTDILSHTPNTGTSWTELLKTGSTAISVLSTGVARVTSSISNVGLLLQANGSYAAEDMEVSAKIVTLDSSDDTHHLAARIVDENNMYLVRLSSTLGNIYRRVGGVWTGLFTLSVFPTIGQTVKFRVVGNLITLYYDNTLAATVYDDGVIGAGLAGMGFGTFGGLNTGDDFTTETSLDDFTVKTYTTKGKALLTKGSIGINTQNPTEALEVVGNSLLDGNLNISGNLTVGGNITVNNVEMISTSNGIIFEGTTNDDFETTLVAVDPTADQTYRLPNKSAGTYTIATTTDLPTVNNATLTIAAGTGVSLSATPTFTANASVDKTITVTNSAPDQTVVLTGAGLVTTSGTYPNFTITGTHPTFSRSNTTSAVSPEFGGTFTAVDLVTTDNGHVTATNLKTITLPSSPTGFTISASATDGIFDITGTGGTNSVSYSLAPYSTKQTTLQHFYLGTTNPTVTTRLNLDSALYATQLYDGGNRVYTSANLPAYPTVNDAALTLTVSAGATNTSVTIGTGTGFTANDATATTYDIDVGPALTNLATTMTGAGTGFLRKNGADTYSLDTNTYLTAHPTITLTTDTTSTANPGYSGTFTAIDSVTRDGNGHVTTLNTKTVTMPAAQSVPTGFNISAGATDGLFDITGTGGTNSVSYAVAPYSSKQTTLQHFYTGTTNPTITTRLNLDAALYATQLYDGGSRVLTAHPAVSAAASSDNSGRTYIQDVLLDSFGHVTGLATATETVTDTNTTYSVSTEAGANIYEEIIRLTAGGSGSGTDDVILAVGPTGTSNTYGLTIAESGDTITFAHADTSTQTSVNNSGRTYIQDVTLDEFGHVTGLVSATETVTDTTYSEISEAEIDSTTDSNGRLITGRRANYLLRNNVTATTTANLATGITVNTATKTVNLGTGGASGSTTNINIGSSVAGTTTINSPSTITSGSLTVGGNLLVNGNLTTINSTTMTVDDPIITLGGDTAPTADDSKDRGVEFRYFDTAARLGFFGYDRSIDSFTGFKQATNTSEVFSGTLLDARFNSFVGSLGAVGTPAFTFTGDTNTGIWSSGDDTLNISTAGSERLRVTSTGNVGIGTTAPGALLSVGAGTGNPASTQFASVIKGHSNGSRTLYLDGVSSASLWWGNGATPQFAIDSISGGGASFWSHASSTWSERMRIISTGNVGIGTTAPAERLEVSGNIIIPNANQYRSKLANGTTSVLLGANSDNTVTIGDGTAGWTALRFFPGGSEAMRILTNGNVGIGTTNPAEKLDVNGSIIARETGAGNGFLLHTNSGISASGNLMQFWSSQTSGLSFHTNGLGDGSNERIRITASGDVGIGTTTPAERLQVIGKTYLSGGSAAWNETTPGQTRGTLHLGEASATSNAGSAITFGARDSSNGTIAQAGIYTRTDGTYGTNMYLATTDAYGSGSKTRLTITSTGLVGIGTTSPAERLAVAGTQRIDHTGANGGTALRINRTDNTAANGALIFSGQNTLRAGIATSYGTSDANGNLEFIAGGNTKALITSTGNLGIGTTSPAQRLEVVGNTKTQDLIISDTSNVAKATMTYDSTSKSVKFVFA
jgi:hypothetical protein